jgi:hypothetical protein
LLTTNPPGFGTGIGVVTRLILGTGSLTDAGPAGLTVAHSGVFCGVIVTLGGDGALQLRSYVLHRTQTSGVGSLARSLQTGQPPTGAIGVVFLHRVIFLKTGALA